MTQEVKDVLGNLAKEGFTTREGIAYNEIKEGGDICIITGELNGNLGKTVLLNNLAFFVPSSPFQPASGFKEELNVQFTALLSVLRTQAKEDKAKEDKE